MFNLKPCPFCGGKAQLFVLKEGGVCVVCKSCDNRTALASDFDYSKTDEMTAVARSIWRWNRRVDSEEGEAKNGNNDGISPIHLGECQESSV